ncbi:MULTISPECIES: polymer-forming cytoskeletal protein [unclassified Flavobacterium]|uniref:polymer-forming cytoskeletal protein n=1 Tax=unclassified Flavobacterium TaxID=196869 RepID=UPI001F14092F|nr:MULTISPECIES: polymer-forming cytoskeletal protein [unclassified Flavobacterium]UMY66254.1 polymer-forming cytoskeletal protein [Flavobacterium sp. HJ-32-4]
MVKANSLIYAVYVCLVIGILCAGLLFVSDLYSRLNLHYNSLESLYIAHRSAVHYALGQFPDTETTIEGTDGIASQSSMRPYGVFDILSVQSHDAHDSIASCYLAAPINRDPTCLFVSRISRSISYSGAVRLIGEKSIPGGVLTINFLSGEKTTLQSEGPSREQQSLLPPFSDRFEKAFQNANFIGVGRGELSQGENGVYHRSFAEPGAQLSTRSLDGMALSGNFLVTASDTLVVPRSSTLDNVILRAPVILIEEGFRGRLQAFATKSLLVGKDVVLRYPSVLCLKAPGAGLSELALGEKSRVAGLLVLFGNDVGNIPQHKLHIDPEAVVTGDVYCSGKVSIRGKVNGSVYANRMYYEDGGTASENALVGTWIDVSKRPAFFVSPNLFETNNKRYGIAGRLE